MVGLAEYAHLPAAPYDIPCDVSFLSDLARRLDARLLLRIGRRA